MYTYIRYVCKVHTGMYVTAGMDGTLLQVHGGKVMQQQLIVAAATIIAAAALHGM